MKIIDTLSLTRSIHDFGKSLILNIILNTILFVFIIYLRITLRVFSKDIDRRSERGGCIGQEGGVMIVRNTVFFLVKTKEYIIIYTFFPKIY